MVQAGDDAASKRIHLNEADSIRLGPLTINPPLRTIAHDDGRSEILEPRVMQVLVALARAGDAVVTRDDLVDRCWDGRIVGEDAIIRTISRLRRTSEGLGRGVFRIETITKVGYRLIREDGAVEDTASQHPVPHAVPPVPAAKVARSRWPQIAGLAALLLLAIGVWQFWLRGAAAGRAQTLLIEPLQAASGDSGAQLLRQSLSTDLTRVVVGNDTTLNFVHLDDSAAAPPRADFVVSGEARSNGTTLNAAVRLVDNRSSVILWSREFSGPSADVEALRQRMAIRIAEVLVCALGSRARRPSNIDLATLRLFLSGCENAHTDWPAAREFLGRAVQRRPDFTQARAMYAMATYLNTGGSSTAPPDAQQRLLREAAAEASKVLKDDPQAGEAYAALSGALYNFSSWSGPAGYDIWHKRLDLLRKGAAADPDCFALHTAMAVVLGNTGLKREELPHLERALALDPFAPIGAGNLAEAYAFHGRLVEANRILEQAGRYWPNEFYTGWVRFNVAARVGDPQQAIAMLDDSTRNPASTPPRPDLWRLFLGARGDPSPANVEQARAAIAAAARGESDRRVKIETIQHLTQLGALDDAFSIALALPPVAREFGHTWFGDYMKPFRADPRFLELARRQGLYAIWARSKQWPDFCSSDQLPYRCDQRPAG